MTAVARGTIYGIAYLWRDGLPGNPAFVLLHGIGSNAASWLSFVHALDARFPCFAWDLPGYGESSPLAEAWPSAEDYAVALERFLDRLGLANIVVVGHSLGALIAARFAATRAARTQALVLVSPAAGYGAARGAPLPAAVARRLTDFERLGAAEYARQRAPRLLADPAGRADVRLAVEQAMAALKLPGYAQAVRLLGCADIFQDLRSLTVPTFVLCGASDQITPPEHTRRIAEAVPAAMRARSELPVLMDTTGHALPQEKPDELAALCAALMTSATESAHAR
jgi:pimeloyl-ACP methyl ester carboxylesterase